MAFLPQYIEFRNAIKHLQPKDNLLIKIFLGLVTMILIASMFPRGEAIEYEYNVGGMWVEKDLFAPFSFPIYKDEAQYEKKKRDAAARVYPVFVRDRKAGLAQQESLATLIDAVHPTGEFRMFRLKRDTLQEILNEILRRGIVDQGEVKQGHRFVAVRRETNEEILPFERLYTLDQALNAVETRVLATFLEGKAVTRVMTMFRSVLKPNLTYSQTETDKMVQVAVENVPRTVGYVKENERIIGRHERITEEVKLKLDSFRKIKAEREAEHSHTFQYLGFSLHVAFITMLYAIYLFLFRKRIFHDNAKLALIALLLLMQCVFAYLSLMIEVRAPVQYLIFIPATSMLLTIIFDSRVAFYGTVTAAFLIAGIRGNDYSVALACLVAGAFSVYTVRDIKHRTQIFRSLVFVFLGYACVIVALGLERFAPLDSLGTELVFALANAVFSPVLTYGLLIFFERAFRITTDLTLLELSDTNAPLLRQLSEKAPGTFHHSMTLGNLAEAAAEAIGANVILARVGAYYHDIGKSLKPEYFVENQPPGKSKHNRLRPRMSALIIGSHVKEGLELGRAHGLPDIVLDFIPQHHGTTLISFFYDKALKQAAAKQNPKDEVHEEDYRYPGPKPQTKETGIVMLADAVEATARSLDEPTPQRLEAMIESMIKSRFVEGQLDECELTLRDLGKIKEAFRKILIGIHHSRVKYPEQEKAAASGGFVQHFLEPTGYVREQQVPPSTKSNLDPAVSTDRRGLSDKVGGRDDIEDKGS